MGHLHFTNKVAENVFDLKRCVNSRRGDQVSFRLKDSSISSALKQQPQANLLGMSLTCACHSALSFMHLTLAWRCRLSKSSLPCEPRTAEVSVKKTQPNLTQSCHYAGGEMSSVLDMVKKKGYMAKMLEMRTGRKQGNAAKGTWGGGIKVK